MPRARIVLLFACAAGLSTAAGAQQKPNIVFMMVDNLGWGEIGAYGGGVLRGAETPRLDALATEGMQLLNFNVEPQCTPSRSALMSGRHAIRSGTTKVVWGMPYGLVGWEITWPELLSGAGYATGMFGKWHLGDIQGRFPTDQGFDKWYGILNTTDESQYTGQAFYDPKVVPPPQIQESKRGRAPTAVKDYTLATRRTIDSELNERAIAFMERQVEARKPFFAFIPYTQPHIPPIPHPDFAGRTGNGQWADMLAEIDYRAGQILDAIDRLGIRNQTIVVWCSDNGPEETPSAFGTAGYWRGHYFTTLEGSLRAPFLIRWPGKIEAGSATDEIVHITDVMPTFARIAGYQVPRDRMIDGIDQMAFLTGLVDRSPREGFPAYNGDNMQSYKWRDFKVHFWKQDSMFGQPTRHNVPRVHNLLRDPKELYGMYGTPASGTESLTWVLPAVTKRILAFRATLAKEPPIPTGTPEPYRPPTSKKSRPRR